MTTSSIAYIVTKHVRHLAPWTADDGAWWMGAHRPLCGGAVGIGKTVWTRHETEEALNQALSKPVCRRCLAVLDALTYASRPHLMIDAS